MRKPLLLLVAMLGLLTAKAQIFKTYHPGYYYNNSGQKISGLISYMPYHDKIFFKTDKDASSEKIKIDDIKALVAVNFMNDSLVVLTEDGKDEKKYFAKPTFASPVTRFYYKFKAISSGGVPTMTIGAAPNMNATGSQPAFHNTYSWSSSAAYSSTIMIPMYQDGNTTYELKKSNFIEVLSKAFADVPELAQDIKDEKYKFKQLNEIINQYKSKTKFTWQNVK